MKKIDPFPSHQTQWKISIFFCKFLVNFGKKERLQKISGIEYWKIESDIWCSVFYSSVYFSPSSVTQLEITIHMLMN